LPDLVAQLLFRCQGWLLTTRTRPIKEMTVFSISHRSIGIAVVLSLTVVSSLKAQGPTNPTVPVKSSYQFPVAEEEFRALFSRTTAEKPDVRNRQMTVLNERYDLSNRPDPNAKMSRGKPVQTGVRVKLPAGATWESLSAMSPEEIRDKGLFPAGFLPLPHPKNQEGGMVFPQSTIDEIKKQTGRDMQRFDVDFDIPDHLLPEFPAAIYLTTRPDLGDVSKGELVTTANYYKLFNGILNPKQLEGLRLLLTPFAQQQFNETADRRTEHASLGVACFDCHQNGAPMGRPTRPGTFAHRKYAIASTPPRSAE
jgi:cytochrome c peroxidase